MIDIEQYFLSNYPFLTKEDVQEFMQIGVQKEYEVGDEFIRLGEKKKKIGIVLKGLARAYTIQDSGAEVSVAFVQEGAVACSHDRIYYDTNSNLITDILEPTSILVFDFDAINKMSETNPRINQMKTKISDEFLVKVLKRLNNFVLKNPEERYLALIEDAPELLQRVQLKHLASFLGITPVSLSRLRARINKK